MKNALLVMIALGSFACSSSTADPPDEPSRCVEDLATNPLEVCQVLHRAECEWLERCYPTYFAAYFGSQEYCLAPSTVIKLGANCAWDMRDMGAVLGLGRVTFDSTAVAQAIVESASATCATAPAYVYWLTKASMFQGTLALGAACNNDIECQSGACTSTQHSCGECVAEKTLDSACDPEPLRRSCPEGLQCDSVTQRCVAWGQLDDRCYDDRHCEPPLLCHYSYGIGSCQAPPQEGDPCWLGETCGEVMVCDDATDTCREPLVSADATCDFMHLCAFPYHCESGACVVADAGYEGQGAQLPLLTEGERCYDGICAPGLFCSLSRGCEPATATALCLDLEGFEIWWPPCP